MVKKQKKHAGEEFLYVEIKKSENLQLSLLESLRDVVETLQEFEKIRTIRQHRMTLIHQLRRETKDIHTLVNKVKQLLPSPSLPAVKSKKLPGDTAPAAPKKKSSKKKAAPVKEAPTKPLSEMALLEKELQDIESKLSQLQ